MASVIHRTRLPPVFCACTFFQPSRFMSSHREHRISVILRQNIPDLGNAGQRVVVRRGRARNVLFPKNLAIHEQAHKISAMKKRKGDQDLDDDDTASHHDAHQNQKSSAEKWMKQRHEALRRIVLQFNCKRDDNKNQLFKSISQMDVYKKLVRLHKLGPFISIDHIVLQNNEPIKAYGEYVIKVAAYPFAAENYVDIIARVDPPLIARNENSDF